MPLYFHKKTNHLELSIWRVEEDLSTLYGLLGTLKYEYKELAEEQFNSDHRCKEWIATRVLFHQMMGTAFRISYNENGKPRIEGTPLIQLSISHTKGYVAMITSTYAEVGIDIETFSPRIEKVINRFTSEMESPPTTLLVDDYRKYYIVMWSAKETLFKMNGVNNVDFQNDIRIVPFQIKGKGELSTTSTLYENGKKYQMVNYQMFPTFVLTWAMDNREQLFNIEG
ncbi:MAG: 4'-phosphopantetheinyl transferase superfamily protein [Bacteroidaceae bacterium]